MSRKNFLAVVIFLICIALICVIFLVRPTAITGGTREGNDPPDSLAPGGVKPPFICVNNVLYKHEKIVTSDALDETYVYIGEIESLIPNAEIPTENFQANGGIYPGSRLYQSGTIIIAVYDGHYDMYYFYKNLQKGDVFW